MYSSQYHNMNTMGSVSLLFVAVGACVCACARACMHVVYVVCMCVCYVACCAVYIFCVVCIFLCVCLCTVMLIIGVVFLDTYLVFNPFIARLTQKYFKCYICSLNTNLNKGSMAQNINITKNTKQNNCQLDVCSKCSAFNMKVLVSKRQQKHLHSL